MIGVGGAQVTLYLVAAELISDLSVFKRRLQDRIPEAAIDDIARILLLMRLLSTPLFTLIESQALAYLGLGEMFGNSPCDA